MTDAHEKKVLICDDEPHIRESIRYVVAKEGFKYVQAKDGSEALEKAVTERPDLIILDVGMPGMTGFEVCETLRQEGHQDVYIIILTAFGQATDEQRAYQVGANSFIVKPFSPRALRDKLNQALLGTGVPE